MTDKVAVEDHGSPSVPGAKTIWVTDGLLGSELTTGTGMFSWGQGEGLVRSHRASPASPRITYHDNPGEHAQSTLYLHPRA